MFEHWENKLDELKARKSYQRDMKNCNVFCFTELFLHDDVKIIQLAGYTLHWQDRTAASSKTPGGSICIYSALRKCSAPLNFATFCHISGFKHKDIRWRVNTIIVLAGRRREGTRGGETLLRHSAAQDVDFIVELCLNSWPGQSLFPPQSCLFSR
jgi:hypothetical protein